MFDLDKLTLDELCNLACNDPVGLDFQPDQLITSLDGQVFRLVAFDSQFCDLSHISELSSEYDDPFELVAEIERQMRHPLAFDKWYR